MMYSFISIQFWLFFCLFCVAVFFSFYLPGLVLLSFDKSISKYLKVPLAVVAGIVAWGIQGYVFGYLQVRWASYIYVLVMSTLAFRYCRKDIFPVFAVKFVKKNLLVSFILLAGAVVQLIPVFLSGLTSQSGVSFHGVNAYDGVLHLAYIQGISRQFPPVEPGAYPMPIENYHYWSDLILADLHRVWGIPVIHLFFQYAPLFISLLTGLIALSILHVLGGTKRMMVWFLFFLYFSGDAAYTVYYYLHQQLSFHTPVIDNGVTQFLNMPNALARLVFLGSLIPLHFWFNTKKTVWGVIMMVFFAVLFGIKVYFGIFAALGVGCILFWRVLRFRWSGRNSEQLLSAIGMAVKQYSLLIGVFIVMVAAIYLPPNRSSGGLGFYPLEWPKSLLGPQSLDMRTWWLERQVFEQAGNTLRLLFLDLIAVGIALISVYGMRLIGFMPLKRTFTFLREKTLFFIPPLILFQLLGLFTLQESGGFNVFNFFIVSSLVLSLFASITLSRLSVRTIYGGVVVVFVVVLSIPQAIYEVQAYIGKYIQNHDRVVISRDELEALSYIAQKTPSDAVVQAGIQNEYDIDVPYVSFFSNRFSYLSGDGFLISHNQPISEKQKRRESLFSSADSEEFMKEAKSLGISYIYLRKKDLDKTPWVTNLPKVFENSSVTIISVL